MLAPASYRRIASWVCGWLYVVGNITITLAVNFGSTLFLVACINVFETEPGVGIWDASTWEIFLTFLAITFLCNAVSSLGNRWLPLIDVSAALSPASTLANMQTDRGHLLDVCRCPGHHHHLPGPGQVRTPRCGMGVH